MSGLSCRYCDGHGTVVLNRSWFLSDGYRLERCGVCSGSGVNPPLFAHGGDWLGRQRRKRGHIAEWKGMRPPTEEAMRRALGTLSPDLVNPHAKEA